MANIVQINGKGKHKWMYVSPPSLRRNEDEQISYQEIVLLHRAIIYTRKINFRIIKFSKKIIFIIY